jgi:hypothetical protein
MCSVHYVGFQAEPVNTVSFCETSLDPKAMDAIIKENQTVGLSNPDLEKNLTVGKYPPVLVSLWSERDRAKRRSWLESKVDELHPVLMFELSVAKFVASPTIETIISVSMPLMRSAVFRVLQDAQCSEDPSVKHGDASLRMRSTYEKRLAKKVQEILKRSLQDIVDESRDMLQTAIKAELLKTARLSMSRDLPSPDWIGWHGLSVAISGAPKMYPSCEYKEIRDAYALEHIKALSENL